jgi:hypothetical protein
MVIGVNARLVKRGARCLLAASFAMVVNTACSHAPRNEPAQRAAPREHEAVASLANEHVVVRIHAADGTIYVTSRFAVTDSMVVIEEILRGEKYYPEMNEPHLYQKPAPVKQPPLDVDLPVRMPIRNVTRIEGWKDPHPGWAGVGAGALIGAVLVIGVVILVIEAMADDVDLPLD